MAAMKRIVAVWKRTLAVLVAVLLLPLGAGTIEYADTRGWMHPRLYDAFYVSSWETAHLFGLESKWDDYLGWWSSLAVKPKYYHVSDLVAPS
jgi:hypothetical protein